MSHKTLEQMAAEAGFVLDPEIPNFILDTEGVYSVDEAIRKFAALVAEECAKIAANTFEGGCDSSDDGDAGCEFMGENSADAIRAAFVPARMARSSSIDPPEVAAAKNPAASRMLDRMAVANQRGAAFADLANSKNRPVGINGLPLDGNPLGRK